MLTAPFSGVTGVPFVSYANIFTWVSALLFHSFESMPEELCVYALLSLVAFVHTIVLLVSTPQCNTPVLNLRSVGSRDLHGVRTEREGDLPGIFRDGLDWNAFLRK